MGAGAGYRCLSVVIGSICADHRWRQWWRLVVGVVRLVVHRRLSIDC
jgi:hypothetical protein